VLGVLQSWIAAAERLAARVPEIALSLGARSWPLAALAALFGIALLVVGIRLGPLLTAAGGALVGWIAGSMLPALGAEWALPAALPGWVAAAVLGLTSAFAPAVYPIALGALPGALLGLSAPLGGHPWLGAGLVGLLLAGLALALRRVIIAATAAVPGAALLMASLIALSARFPALGVLARRPMLLLGIGALLAVAGTAFQVGTQRREAPRPARAGTLRRE
jgi:hypothetical protein